MAHKCNITPATSLFFYLAEVIAKLKQVYRFFGPPGIVLENFIGHVFRMLSKPCPHCRRKVRRSPKTAKQRRNSATVALFCDSVDRLLADTVDTTRLVELYICDSAVFCALHDRLASLDGHAQLTRCFSAVAELLVTYSINDI